MKNKKVVCLLSLLFPGLGHLYLGRYTDGIVFMLGIGFLWYALFAENSQAMNFDSPRLYIFWIGSVVIYLFAFIDSYKKATKISRGE